MRAAARAAHSPQRRLRGRRRRSAALLVAAVAVVLGSAAWIVALHRKAGDENDRGVRLVEVDRELHAIQLLQWRGIAGDLEPQIVLVQATVRWRGFRARLERLAPSLTGKPLDGVEGLLAQTMGEIGIPQQSLERARRVGAPLTTRIADVNRLVDVEIHRAEAASRTARARAWRLTGLTGGLALLIVTLLLTAWARTRRDVRRALAAAAHAEGERGALHASSRRFHALVQHASEAVLVIDADGDVSFATPSVDGLLGHADLDGRALAAFVAPEDAGRLEALVVAARESGVPSKGELTLVHRDGHLVHAEVRVADRLGDPDVGGVVLAVRDVSDRRRLERQLRHSAQRDPLTGLPNRASFEDRLRDVLAEDAPRAAVLLLDLDDFETVNDSLGHVGGDRVLVLCADRLRAAAGAATVARLGSDEFAVLLEGVSQPEHAERIARELAAAVSLPARIESADIPITVTAGLALAAPGLGPEDLLRCADTALHIAQSRGSGELQAYSPSMHTNARRRLELRAALTHAVRAGALELAYQPIVDLGRGEATGVEALLRWTLADGTRIPPAEFIPLAESSGLIVELGAWVLERACADVAPLATPSGEPLRVSVNVSAIQLRAPGFPGQVAGALERTGLAPSRLTLELTESVVVDDVVSVSEAFDDLRTLGVLIAVDDFGTGFSSLASLADLPIDALKLDRSFIAAMDGGGSREALVAGVISLADRLGLPIVAEGIETAEQLATLRRLGCAFAQGYHLGRPAPLTALAAFVPA
jgi:diguanylate cyclase (GGDEF)-like protein/PAS domain S-box-containing protein